MRDSCGYITVACGERRYLEMATDLALSLRAFDRRFFIDAEDFMGTLQPPAAHSAQRR